MCEESLRIGREIGDRWNIVQALSALGALALRQGNLARAQTLVREEVQLARQLGDRMSIAGALSELGSIEQRCGNLGQAGAHYAESLTILRDMGSLPGIAIVLSKQGFLAQQQGDPERARRSFQDSLALYAQHGDPALAAGGLVGLAGLESERRSDRAALLLGSAAALFEASAATAVAFDQTIYERHLAAVHAQLSAATFERAWAAGRALSADQAIAEALRSDD